MRWVTVTLLGYLVATNAQAQTRLAADQFCTYLGKPFDEELHGFDSDQEAQEALKRIMRFTGLEPNFTIMAANVPNAAAVIRGQTRMILYNQAFMESIRAASPAWSNVSILAHEIGHHLQGHTLLPGGSRPEIELQADKYSGYVLQRMGATLDESQAAMRTFGTDASSPTHPGKQARLAAIANGWFAARDLNSNKPSSGTPNPTPAPQTPPPGPPPAQNVYIHRAVFPGDPYSYYITSSDDIVTVTPQGQVVPVGRKIPPTVTGFVWMYSTAIITYGVDAQGRIWNRYPNGVPFQVGYVTKP